MNRYFSGKQVCEKLGLEAMELKVLVDNGIPSHSAETAKIRGARLKFTWKNLMEILLAKQLRAYGYRLNEVKLVFVPLKASVKLGNRLDPNGVWRKMIRKTPIGEYARGDYSTRSKVRLIVMDLNKGKEKVKVRFTRRHKPALRLDSYGEVRIVPIEALYRKVERWMAES